MGYISPSFGNVCGAGNNRIAFSYNIPLGRINVSLCLNHIAIANSYAPHASTHRIDIISTNKANTNTKQDYLNSLANSFDTLILSSGTYDNRSMTTTISKSQYLSLVLNQPMGAYYYEQDTVNSAEFQIDKIMNLSVTDTVPVIPGTPTFTLINSCYEGNPSVKIEVTSTITNVDYWSIQRSTTSGGTYTELTKLYTSGTTEYYDTTATAGTFWYKVVANNVAWSTSTNVVSFTVKPPASTDLTAGIITTNFPILTYTGNTGALCSGSLSVNWYIDGVLKATTTGSTYTGNLLEPNTDYTLTTKISGNTGLSIDSNPVTLNFPLIEDDAPSLTATLGVSSVNLSWTDGNDYHQKYEIGRGDAYNEYTFKQPSLQNLQSHWRLNSTFYDDISNADFAGYGSLIFVDGIDNKALNFNGTDSYIALPQGVYCYERNQSYSYGLWFKRANTNTGVYTLFGNYENNRGYTAYISGNTLFLDMGAGNSVLQIQKKIANFAVDTLWHHLVVTYNGSSNASGLLAYLDGQPLALATVKNNINSGSIIGNRVKLCARSNDSTGLPENFFPGIVDDICMWNTVLTPVQVAALGESRVTYPILVTVTGNTYSDYDVVVGQTYKYHVRGLIDNFTIDYRSPWSNEVVTNVTSIIVAPSNLTTEYVCPIIPVPGMVYYDIRLTWVNNNISGVTGNKIEKLVNGVWTLVGTAGATSTQFRVRNFPVNTTNSFRVTAYNGDRSASSNVSVITIGDFQAPANLHTTVVGDKTISIAWDNITTNYSINVWLQKESQPATFVESLPSTANTYTFTGLTMDCSYHIFVNNMALCGYEKSSNTIAVTTTYTFIPSFCQNDSYVVTPTTCGNSTGVITIPEDATIFYDFSLEDIFGNVKTLTDYYWSGLTASWYKITASVKPKWYFHYGNDACVIGWIPLPDTNTTITLNDTKIRSAVCGGFGSDKGRIVYQLSDSSNANHWTFSLFNERYELVNTQSLTGISTIIITCDADIYYGVVENNNGCTYLIDLTTVGAEKLYVVEGIERLFLTPWSPGISYNYYDNTSDDWYVAGLDSQQFTSTKIAEYNGLDDYWYEIKLDTARMTYNQVLQKSQNGLTYVETINVTIPHADNSKWKQLVNLLSKRYIIVFQDNNDNYWTCFYRSGAEVKSYQLAENQYTIAFQHPSVNKMLTAIDKNYVKLHIL